MYHDDPFLKIRFVFLFWQGSFDQTMTFWLLTLAYWVCLLVWLPWRQVRRLWFLLVLYVFNSKFILWYGVWTGTHFVKGHLKPASGRGIFSLCWRPISGLWLLSALLTWLLSLLHIPHFHSQFLIMFGSDETKSFNFREYQVRKFTASVASCAASYDR